MSGGRSSAPASPASRVLFGASVAGLSSCSSAPASPASREARWPTERALRRRRLQRGGAALAGARTHAYAARTGIMLPDAGAAQTRTACRASAGACSMMPGQPCTCARLRVRCSAGAGDREGKRRGNWGRASEPRGATLLSLRVLSGQGAGLRPALARARAKGGIGLVGVCALSGWEHLHARGESRMCARCRCTFESVDLNVGAVPACTTVLVLCTQKATAMGHGGSRGRSARFGA